MLLTILILEMVPVSRALPLFSLNKWTCGDTVELVHQGKTHVTSCITSKHMYLEQNKNYTYLVYEHQCYLQVTFTSVTSK